MSAAVNRGLTVLKMRGSPHDRDIREFVIKEDGMHFGRPFRHVTGILAGTPRHISPGDVERVWSSFESETSRREEAAGRGEAAPPR
ncbi:MAG TPA: hypothetical protein VK933_15825 [Longimicrobiales bacterium]|nr:hypothetical protein [Longimicrobiales bacterium]